VTTSATTLPCDERVRNPWRGVVQNQEFHVSNWIKVCAIDDLDKEDVRRFEYGDRVFAICRSPEGEFFATDGHCTHEHTELADGLVVGYEIECPRHRGTFDYRTGEALLAPACIDLKCYKVRVDDKAVFILID